MERGSGDSDAIGKSQSDCTVRSHDHATPAKMPLSWNLLRQIISILSTKSASTNPMDSYDDIYFSIEGLATIYRAAGAGQAGQAKTRPLLLIA